MMEKIVVVKVLNKNNLHVPIESIKKKMLTEAIYQIIDTDLYDFDIKDYGEFKKLKLSFYIDSCQKERAENRVQLTQIKEHDFRVITSKEIIISKIKQLFLKKPKR